MTQHDPSQTPTTIADAASELATALVNLYIELNWPVWVLFMRLIHRVPDRAEFEQAVRAYYLGTAADEEDADA